MDFTNYKFRPSAMGKIMTNGRSKSDPLSETTKTYLKEIWIEEVFGRKREITSKYLEKGTLVEEDSIDLASKVLGIMMVKNEERLSNEWIIGTPDVILSNEVIDIKSSWDIWSFAGTDGDNKDYYWQLQSYMFLTGLKRARLVYCLVDSPEHLIVDEVRMRAYRNGVQGNDDAIAEIERAVDKNMRFEDIDAKLRIKPFSFEYSEGDIMAMQTRILDCREYLSNLSL